MYRAVEDERKIDTKFLVKKLSKKELKNAIPDYSHLIHLIENPKVPEYLRMHIAAFLYHSTRSLEARAYLMDFVERYSKDPKSIEWFPINSIFLKFTLETQFSAEEIPESLLKLVAEHSSIYSDAFRGTIYTEDVSDWTTKIYSELGINQKLKFIDYFLNHVRESGAQDIRSGNLLATLIPDLISDNKKDDLKFIRETIADLFSKRVAALEFDRNPEALALTKIDDPESAEIVTKYFEGLPLVNDATVRRISNIKNLRLDILAMKSLSDAQRSRIEKAYDAISKLRGIPNRGKF
jgi:hypothetical protein